MNRFLWCRRMAGLLLGLWLTLQPALLIALPDSVLAPSSRYVNGGNGNGQAQAGKDRQYAQVISDVQEAWEFLAHKTFKRSEIANPQDMEALRLYVLAAALRDVSPGVRGTVLGYFQSPIGKKHPIRREQGHVLAKHADAEPGRLMEELISVVPGATLQGLKRLHAQWLKRGLNRTYFAPLFREELQRVLGARMALACGDKELPLPIYLITPAEQEKNFLQQIQSRTDALFLKSHASQEAIRAAQSDLLSALRIAEAGGTAQIDNIHYLDFVGDLEAQEVLPHLLPLAKGATLIEMGSATGSFIRAWMREHPDPTGRRIAIEKNAHYVLAARELSPKSQYPTLEIREADATRLHPGQWTFVRDEAVQRIFAKQWMQELHENKNTGKFLDGIAEIDRILAPGGMVDIVDPGNTPPIVHALFLALGYDLVQKRHVRGVQDSHGYLLLSLEKPLRKAAEEPARKRLEKAVAKFGGLSPFVADPAALIHGFWNGIPDPDKPVFGHVFPAPVLALLTKKLIYRPELASLVETLRFNVDDVATLRKDNGLMKLVQPRTSEERVKIMQAIAITMNAELDPKTHRPTEPQKLWDALVLYKHIAASLEGQRIARETVKALESVLGPERFGDLRRDFENMYGKTDRKVDFGAKLITAWIHESLLFGNKLWLLRPAGTVNTDPWGIIIHRYEVPKEAMAILEKTGKELRRRAMRMAYKTSFRRDLFQNLGITDPLILKAKDPLRALWFAHAARLQDENAPRVRQILQDISGKSAAELVKDYAFEQCNAEELHLAIRAALFYGGPDALERLKDFALSPKGARAGTAGIVMDILAGEAEIPSIREAAVRMLGLIGKKGHAPKLIHIFRRLGKYHDELKIAFFHAFEDLGATQAIPLLRQYALGPYPERLRYKAAQTLYFMGMLGNVPAARQALRPLLQDALEIMRDMARQALAFERSL